ncbi:MAG: EamA family transporter RarD [Armatimonadetes bacterium]|nr:MAG: EamA family transporter RarD [Armatimonadota bacterium]
MESRRGVWFGLGAYVIWGFSPVYWNLIDDVDATVLLIHRIMWSVPLLAAIIAIQRRFGEVRKAFSSWRTVAITSVAAVLLATNWGVFLWAVTHDHIVEGSLGYFINPLVSVALGVVVLGERLRPMQWLAVGIAAVGVVGMAVMVGSPPWIALTLAFAFGLYGLIKKRPEVPAPLISLQGELAVMVIPALVVLVFFIEPTGQDFGDSAAITMFLIGSGAFTITPLLMFGASAKRIPLSLLGLLQYIAPSLQLVLGIWVYNENLSLGRLLWFGVVWIALGVYTYDGIMTARRGRAQTVVSYPY